MAIVFVTVIGLAMAAGLGYASATLRAQTNAYAPARDKLYAADAAMKAALNYVRSNPTEGNSSSNPTCAPVRDFGTVRGDKVTTQVCPQGGNSLVSLGSGSAWGLQALATGAEKGVVVNGSGGLKVNGNVMANSSIDVANSGRLDISGGTVKALGGCNRNVYVDGALLSTCTVAAAPASDPGYTLPTSVDASVLGGGSCNSATSVATLTPGTWTQSTFDTAIGKCDYVQLSSGYHYLENISWTIKNKVVGGTLAGDIKKLEVGTTCVQGTSGTTLILGGTTTITLSGAAASLEVCGTAVTQPNGKAVELPLYGLTADVVGSATASDTLTNTAETGSSGSGTKWSNSERAKAVDGSNATVSLAAGDTTNNLDIGGFSGTKPIPSTITQLTATVVGSVGPSGRSATFAISILDSSGNTLCAPVSGTFPASAAKVSVTLTCAKTLKAPLMARIVATADKSPKEDRQIQLDGVTLSYATASSKMLAQSGCVTQVNGCAVLSSNGNGNVIFLDGEVYLPKAKIDVQLPASSTALSTLGLTVRVLQVNTPNSAVSTPIVAIENGGLKPGDVTIVVKVGATSWMSCRVSFVTNSGTTIQTATIQGCTVPY
jgi:hypothetical protein